MTLAPGQTVGGYQIVEQIGRGGMATVFKAYQTSLSRFVAIKLLPAVYAEDHSFRVRFQNEATAIARLRHPNILAVYDYGEHEGVPYIVTELVSGGTLSALLGTPLSATEAVETVMLCRWRPLKQRGTRSQRRNGSCSSRAACSKVTSFFLSFSAHLYGSESRF